MHTEQQVWFGLQHTNKEGVKLETKKKLSVAIDWVSFGRITCKL